jgi:hypothetical protein
MAEAAQTPPIAPDCASEHRLADALHDLACMTLIASLLAQDAWDDVRDEVEQRNAADVGRINRFDALKFAVYQIDTMTCDLRAKHLRGDLDLR